MCEYMQLELGVSQSYHPKIPFFNHFVCIEHSKNCNLCSTIWLVSYAKSRHTYEVRPNVTFYISLLGMRSAMAPAVLYRLH